MYLALQGDFPNHLYNGISLRDIQQRGSVGRASLQQYRCQGGNQCDRSPPPSGAKKPKKGGAPLSQCSQGKTPRVWVWIKFCCSVGIGGFATLISIHISFSVGMPFGYLPCFFSVYNLVSLTLPSPQKPKKRVDTHTHTHRDKMNVMEMEYDTTDLLDKIDKFLLKLLQNMLHNK